MTTDVSHIDMASKRVSCFVGLDIGEALVAIWIIELQPDELSPDNHQDKSLTAQTNRVALRHLLVHPLHPLCSIHLYVKYVNNF